MNRHKRVEWDRIEYKMVKLGNEYGMGINHPHYMVFNSPLFWYDL